MFRRDFLKLMIGGAASLQAGWQAVSLGAEAVRFDKLIPFLKPPEGILPGVATWFATSCRECPAGCGMVLANREGRAIKAEGNPLHPINAGKLCARGQAALQGLYDPDRVERPVKWEGAHGHAPLQWEAALAEIGGALAQSHGRVAVLSDLQSGSLAALIREWLGAFGSGRYLAYEPFNYESLREANRLVFGKEAIPDYHLDQCDVVLSLGADFVETWVSPVKWIRRFAETRAPSDGRMSKLIYVGPRLSLTGLNADEHLLLPPGDERWLGLAVLYTLAEEGMVRADREAMRTIAADFPPERVGARLKLDPARLRRVARQLGRARCPVVLAGSPSPAGRAATEAAAIAGLLNRALASPAVDFSRTHALGETASSAQVREFVTSLGEGKVETLIILGANPAYSLPPDLRFAEAVTHVRNVVSLSSFRDEMAQLANWVLPASTALESWGDYRPETGVINLMQPVMGNRLPTRSYGDILLSLAKAAGVDTTTAFGAGDFYDYLRRQWRQLAAQVAPGQEAEGFWEEALRRGGHWAERAGAQSGAPLQGPVPEGAPAGAHSGAPIQGPVPEDAPAGAQHAVPLRVEDFRLSMGDREAGIQLYLYPSATLFDGRGANKRWLQELPDVVNHAVWESWVELNPATARELGVKSGEVVEVTSRIGRLKAAVPGEEGRLKPAVPGRPAVPGELGKVRAPAYLFKGVCPGVIAVPWGQGHTEYGRYAEGRGANAFQLLSAEAGEGSFSRVDVRGVDAISRLVTTDGSTSQEGRRLVEAVLLSQLGQQRPAAITWPTPEGYSPETDLYPPHPHKHHRWAMAIDISRCVGCEACVAACYAENNIGVVGKDWVAQGREMSWLRIDRYFDWESAHSPALFLPMLCQHCDAAPCEPVCPVFAAHHTEEGLNAQIYNRCIGTRYCSNNCPYKVRRFNWRNYRWPEPLTWQLNPEVTVRVRGVMEKCTFCVQRIRRAEYQATKEGRPVRDGEITPACAQTCPAEVFVFGDLMDPESRLSRLVRDHPRRFQALQELNTKPAVFYLRKVFNDLPDGRQASLEPGAEA